VNLSWLDWTIMAVAVVALRFVSLSTRRYMRGVADFLSANRTAGRYLLTIAGQMGGTGAISIVALFEMYHGSGFPPMWWGLMSIPVGAIILLTGWVYYRYRETRALTLAQFLEMRYTRRFRIFSGFLIWGCGILNFGIFPAVAARFFIYFCGLPDHFMIPGIPLQIATFPVVMAVDLLLALTFVNMGGQISVMVTECAQGIVSAFIFIILAGFVLMTLKWGVVEQALLLAPAEKSMLHPFHTSNVTDFNVWFFLIGVFGSFYGASGWQGSSGFMTSSRTPHEQKMGGIIGIWRQLPLTLMSLMLPIAAYVVLKSPEYEAQAQAVKGILDTIPNETIRGEMTVPIALAQYLPVGIKGLLAVVMLFFSFTCHDTYMHSWGSIFVQDVYLPLKQKVISPEEHVRLLRWSIVGVAAFAFLFSWLYPPTQKILMFFAITGTIWAGGSGAVLIGGLYWRKGTTAASYAALILGAVVGVGGLIVPEIYKAQTGQEFPVNGQWLWMLAMLGSIVVYIVVSLLTCRPGQEFDLDKMLHRGKYRVAHDHVAEHTTSRWLQIVGITSEFSTWDRVLAIALVVWNAGWFLTFLVVTVMNLVVEFPYAWWSRFWHFYIWLYFIISVPATIWFTIGGIHDIRALFRELSTIERDHTDDGRVVREAETEAEAPA
jgi:SSS family solute:Na+ symporter